MNVYSYVLTCSRTRDRLRAFKDSWIKIRKGNEEDAETRANGAGRPIEQSARRTKKVSFCLFPLATVWGMNSERFPRSPWWRVADHPVDGPDKQYGNGLNRLGHTACYWGHVQEWRQALGEHDDDFDAGVACFFEDDCQFDEDFWTRADAAFKELPADWDILYFGGQHCVNGRPRPQVFSENLYRVENVNRTHAYAIKLSSLPKVILWFEENHDWGHNFKDPKTGQSEAEVDYALGSLTESGFLNGYALRRWACGQAPGMSATQGRFQPNGRWELF